MASPDFGLRRDSAEQQQFPHRASADQHNPGPGGHNACDQGGNFRVRQSESAVDYKRSQRAIVIKQENAARSGTQSFQKRTVGGVTFEYLHAGFLTLSKRQRRKAGPDASGGTNGDQTTHGYGSAPVKPL